MRNFVIVFLLILGFSCRSDRKQQTDTNPTTINNMIGSMTDIMVHDVTNPPLAARFFAYACLSGYEIISQNNTVFKSMHGVLKGYPKMNKPDSIKDYSYPTAAILAMITTARKMQPSGKLLDAYENRFIDSCKRAGLSEEVIENSKRYAMAVSKQILAYAKADNYNRISNYARYSPHKTEGSWFPTPPAYIAAVEPNFNTVRPFFLDSCTQFKPQPPIPFSKNKNSAFFELMLVNYQDTLTNAKREIAAFWDCNPFAVQDNGHLLVGLKKISPGAHWLGIAGIACTQAKKNFDETMQIHTLVSLGLMDAFICCWDEKFRSNRIRPETAIRNYIDPSWQPFLQTPPFPEYVSGHSTISACSATILTKFFGDHFKYIDTTESRFGLAPRQFSSFKNAAEEAAISRFYGGIHFMDAIDNGLLQGEKVGTWILSKIVKQDKN